MRKKILIYGTNYFPEPIGIPRYTTEMAEDLNTKGHDVTVVTAYPLYPDWKKKSGYSYWKYSSEKINGVKVIRVPTYVPSNTGFFSRIIYEIAFAFFSLPIVIFKGWAGLQNLIVTLPPLVIALTLFFFPKNVHKTIIVKDMQVDIAANMGIIKSRRFLNFLFVIEKKILSRADLVTAVSENMVSLIRSRGIDAENIAFFPDWVATNKLVKVKDEEVLKLKKELGLPFDKTIVGYSGNLARKQGIELLLSIAAKYAIEDSDVIFLICGDGPAKSSLRDTAISEGMKDVYFSDLVSEDELPVMISLIDIHLIPQKNEVSDLVMPGKIFNIMSCSTPFIVTAPSGSSLDNLIKESCAGFRVDRSDEDTILDKINVLKFDKRLREKMGREGRKYVESRYSKEKVLGEFYRRLDL